MSQLILNCPSDIENELASYLGKATIENTHRTKSSYVDATAKENVQIQKVPAQTQVQVQLVKPQDSSLKIQDSSLGVSDDGRDYCN